MLLEVTCKSLRLLGSCGVGRYAVCGDHYDIYEIEGVGPCLVLHHFGHLIPEGSLWIHFIDNEAALATLVKGSSSVMSGEVITAHTHSLIAASGLWPWFGRVSSKDNPVDQLSRKDERPMDSGRHRVPSIADPRIESVPRLL